MRCNTACSSSFFIRAVSNEVQLCPGGYGRVVPGMANVDLERLQSVDNSQQMAGRAGRAGLPRLLDLYCVRPGPTSRGLGDRSRTRNLRPSRAG